MAKFFNQNFFKFPTDNIHSRIDWPPQILYNLLTHIAQILLQKKLYDVRQTIKSSLIFIDKFMLIDCVMVMLIASAVKMKMVD